MTLALSMRPGVHWATSTLPLNGQTGDPRGFDNTLGKTLETGFPNSVARAPSSSESFDFHTELPYLPLQLRQRLDVALFQLLDTVSELLGQPL